MKVYPIVGTSVHDCNAQVHAKAYTDWNLAVRYLVETYGVNQLDIRAGVDIDGCKSWSVEKPSDPSIIFTIHQLDLS